MRLLACKSSTAPVTMTLLSEIYSTYVKLPLSQQSLVGTLSIQVVSTLYTFSFLVLRSLVIMFRNQSVASIRFSQNEFYSCQRILLISVSIIALNSMAYSATFYLSSFLTLPNIWIISQNSLFSGTVVFLSYSSMFSALPLTLLRQARAVFNLSAAYLSDLSMFWLMASMRFLALSLTSWIQLAC